MEYYWTLFNNSNSTSCTNRAVAAAAHNVGNSNNNNNNNNTWESWELGGGNNAGGSGVSRVDWSYPFHNSLNCAAPVTDASGGKEYQPVYFRPDPHLTCLKLGKRHYFEHVTAPPMADGHMAAAGRSVSKKGKPYLAGTEIDATSAAVVVVPRCQVEGCDVVLVNAKEYHRRHKVCEMHAKAPKVVVLGMEQRFCQQCSRFHAVAEFDETKRSCRKRLAGHNERRRKSSQEQHSLAKKVPYQDMKTMIGASTHPQYLLNSRDCALSLLSSPNYTFPYNINPNALLPPSSTADLPSRCSAALWELIAENRASILAFRQLMNPNNYQIEDDYTNNNTFKPGSDPEENGGHVTLDLMQAPTSAFGAFSVHDDKSSSKTGGNEEDCSELWKVPDLGNY